MTTRAKIFRFFLVLQFCGFFGLIALGVYQDDAFDARLLIPITILGVACGINTFALLDNRGL